jgi:hypothetical protein
MKAEYHDLLKKQSNDHTTLVERKPGVWQVLMPVYHADGDMYSVFVEDAEKGMCRVCDHGLTLMRLSYSFEIDTHTKQKVYSRILAEAGAGEEDGSIFLDAKPERLYEAVMQFIRVVTQVMSLQDQS